MEPKDIVALVVLAPLAFVFVCTFIFMGALMLRAAWEVITEGL